MTLSECMTRISYALRGTDDDAPVSSSEEYTYWLSLINRKKDELYQDTSRQWSFTYKATAPNEIGTVATTGTTTLTGTGTFFADYNVGDQITVDGETVRTIATITSNTVLTVTLAFSNTASAKTFTRTTIIKTGDQTYSVHRSLLAVSDKVYALSGDNKTYLDLIHPQEQDYVTQQVHLSGGNPQVLTFTIDLEATDALIGQSLVIPGYYLPADLTTSTDLLPVPDPNWLAIATASEIAFADIVYEDRAEALNARANALWKQMVANNRRETYGKSRRTPYNTVQIRDTRVG